MMQWEHRSAGQGACGQGASLVEGYGFAFHQGVQYIPALYQYPTAAVHIQAHHMMPIDCI